VYATYFILVIPSGTENVHRIIDMPNYLFYLPGRLSIALVGVATVWFTYHLVTNGYRNRLLGLLAALFLAFSPIHVEESRYITPNVLSGFFVVLSLFFASRILENSSVSSQLEVTRNYILAGLFAGLAASTKYNAALVAVSMLTTYLLSLRTSKIACSMGLGAMVFGFLAGTPYAIFDPETFLYGVRTEQIHYRFQGSQQYFWWYADYLFHAGVGQVVSILIIVGLIYGLSLNWRSHLITNVFLLCYFFADVFI
jgi:dolichyl-phosphate-mannose--protein O-mannosyl transferase